MTDMLSTPVTALPETITARVQAWLDKLNADEVIRRAVVNAEHFANYGRTLYDADDKQYATYTLDKPGAKYTRVVMTTNGDSRSVHAFLDRAGNVYKSAGWARPATGVRYALASDADFLRILERCDFAGGYLYAGRNR